MMTLMKKIKISVINIAVEHHIGIGSNSCEITIIIISTVTVTPKFIRMIVIVIM